MTKREAYLSFKCWHCVFFENEYGEYLAETQNQMNVQNLNRTKLKKEGE